MAGGGLRDGHSRARDAAPPAGLPRFRAFSQEMGATSRTLLPTPGRRCTRRCLNQARFASRKPHSGRLCASMFTRPGQLCIAKAAVSSAAVGLKVRVAQGWCGGFRVGALRPTGVNTVGLTTLNSPLQPLKVSLCLTSDWRWAGVQCSTNLTGPALHHEGRVFVSCRGAEGASRSRLVRWAGVQSRAEAGA